MASYVITPSNVITPADLREFEARPLRRTSPLAAPDFRTLNYSYSSKSLISSKSIILPQPEITDEMRKEFDAQIKALKKTFDALVQGIGIGIPAPPTPTLRDLDNMAGLVPLPKPQPPAPEPKTPLPIAAFNWMQNR